MCASKGAAVPGPRIIIRTIRTAISYRLDDHDTGGSDPPGDLGSGEFRYEGSDPAAYSDTFIKETNKEENNYTDLINFTRIASAPASGGNAAQFRHSRFGLSCRLGDGARY